MRPHVLRWLESILPSDVANALAPTWFTCIGLAGLASLFVLLFVARRRGLDRASVVTIAMWGYVAAIVAGIFLPMLYAGFEHLFETGRFTLRWSGMTSYCGYIGGAAAIAIACDREHIPLATFADAAVAPLGLALLFARAGCFMAGCDYGRVTSLPWGVHFPAGSPAWRDQIHAGLLPPTATESLAVHPTELYEALLGVAILALGVLAARRAHRPGRAFLAAAALYSLGRLVVEALRGDDARGVYAGISSGQLFSLAVLVAIAVAMLRSASRASTASSARAMPCEYDRGPRAPARTSGTAA